MSAGDLCPHLQINWQTARWLSPGHHVAKLNFRCAVPQARGTRAITAGGLTGWLNFPNATLAVKPVQANTMAFEPGLGPHPARCQRGG